MGGKGKNKNRNKSKVKEMKDVVEVINENEAA